MLVTCPPTRSERFSNRIFSVQNKSTNTALETSKMSAMTLTPWREKELVSRSHCLWASHKITCNNEHQCCQIIIEWKDFFVVAHLHRVPLVSINFCFRTQAFLERFALKKIADPLDHIDVCLFLLG